MSWRNILKEFKDSGVFVDKLKEIYNDLESDVREIKLPLMAHINS